MSCCVKGQIKTIYLPQFPSQQDKIPAGINIEHLVSASLAAVFLYDLKRNIQQTDRRERIGLFPVDMNSPCAVAGLRDVLVRKPFQIRIRQSGKG